MPRKKLKDRILEQQPVDPNQGEEVTEAMQRFRKGKSNPTKTPKRNAQNLEKKRRQFNVVLEEETYNAFSDICDRQRLTMASVVRSLVENYVEQNSK